MIIYGINPVLEALRAGRVASIRVSPRADDRLTAVVRLAEERGVIVRRVAAADLDRAARAAGSSDNAASRCSYLMRAYCTICCSPDRGLSALGTRNRFVRAR